MIVDAMGSGLALNHLVCRHFHARTTFGTELIRGVATIERISDVLVGDNAGISHRIRP